MKFLFFLVLILNINSASAWTIFGPRSYEDCILANMKGVTSDNAAGQIRRSCKSKFPHETQKTIECVSNPFTSSERSKLEGTAKYGNMVVCRLNNLPKVNQPIGVKGHEDYVEECKDMPAEFAYWAVLEKRKQSIPNPADLNSKWAWAQVGVAELALNVGDSVAFVFADNGNLKFPE